MTPTDKLLAAIDVFMRYGYRKTSMEDVAAAVGVSRQALYKKYASKDALFRALLENLILHSRQSALNALADDDAPPPARILAAFDAWHGHYVDMLRASPHSSEIVEIADGEIREIALNAEAEIAEAVTKLLGRRSKWTADAAFTLFAASKGLMQKAETHQDYTDGMKRAITVCTPRR